MGVIKKDNKFVSYLIILLALFILILVTLNQYKVLQENLDNNYNIKTKIDEKTEIINKNDEIRSKIKEDISYTEKYLVDIKENEIIDYIYSYIEKSDSPDSRINIKSIDITEWKKNELWFLESNIKLSLQVSNEKTLKRLLDFFTSKDSKYNFFITNFNYPNDWREWSFNVEIPLKIFYK